MLLPTKGVRNQGLLEGDGRGDEGMRGRDNENDGTRGSVWFQYGSSMDVICNNTSDRADLHTYLGIPSTHNMFFHSRLVSPTITDSYRLPTEHLCITYRRDWGPRALLHAVRLIDGTGT